MHNLKIAFILGLGISAIFLGVRVGGDFGHWILSQVGQPAGSTPLS